MSAQQAFNQPSLFIPSAASQAEYLSTSQLGFPQRSHGFAQSAVPAPPPSAQQNTIIAPPATAALMSTNLKMPGPSHSMDPRQTSAFGTGKTVLSTLVTSFVHIASKSCSIMSLVTISPCTFNTNEQISEPGGSRYVVPGGECDWSQQV